VALPGVAAAALDEHLSIYAATGVEGVVFTGKRGGPMRRGELSEEWRKAVAKVASAPGDLHVHDLRHAAAKTGRSKSRSASIVPLRRT
jgi:integrase